MKHTDRKLKIEHKDRKFKKQPQKVNNTKTDYKNMRTFSSDPLVDWVCWFIFFLFILNLSGLLKEYQPDTLYGLFQVALMAAVETLRSVVFALFIIACLIDELFGLVIEIVSEFFKKK